MHLHVNAFAAAPAGVLRVHSVVDSNLCDHTKNLGMLSNISSLTFQVITTETLFGTMNKTLRLLEMGFTGDEVSAAIDRFGQLSL